MPTSRQISGIKLAAAINPFARPGGGMPNGPGFAIKIVQCVKLVMGLAGSVNVASDEQQVRGKPSVRQAMGGRGD